MNERSALACNATHYCCCLPCHRRMRAPHSLVSVPHMHPVPDPYPHLQHTLGPSSDSCDPPPPPHAPLLPSYRSPQGAGGAERKFQCTSDRLGQRLPGLVLPDGDAEAGPRYPHLQWHVELGFWGAGPLPTPFPSRTLGGGGVPIMASVLCGCCCEGCRAVRKTPTFFC